MQTRYSLSPEEPHGDEARHWATFSDVALAMLLVFLLFILAQFLQYERVFVLQEIDRRKALIAGQVDSLAAGWPGISVAVQDEDELRQRIRISGEGQLVFQACRDDLRETGERLMVQLGTVLAANRVFFSAIEVEGHADRQPPTGIVCRNEGIEDNWQLSTRRATEVVRVFSGQSALSDTILSSVGKGHFHSLSSPGDTTPEALEQDRRIEVVLRYTEDIEVGQPGA